MPLEEERLKCRAWGKQAGEGSLRRPDGRLVGNWLFSWAGGDSVGDRRRWRAGRITEQVHGVERGS